jgi:hypothetical protein
MATTQLSSRDWEVLSAFLDGQLSAQEKALLETRLKESPELQNGLEEMQRTRAVLRSLPRYHVPRNFTLTPAMVGKKSQLRLFPVMRLASIMASILLVLTFVGEWLSTSWMAQQAAPMAAMPVEEEVLTNREMPGAETLHLDETQEAYSSTILILPTETSVAEMAPMPLSTPLPNSDEIEAAESTTEMPRAAKAMPTEEMLAGMGGGEPQPESPAMPQEAPADAAAPEPLSVATATATPTQTEAPPPPYAGQASDLDGGGTTPPEYSFTSIMSFTWVRGLQIGLILIAFFTGAMAIYLRRRRK